jgi:uncharacterized protein
MAANENKRILQNVFAQLAKGDGRPFVEAMADDVRWTIMGSTKWSRTYEGKKDVLTNLLGPLNAVLAPPNVIVAHRLVAEGDLVVVEAKGHNKTKSGAPYENTYCWVIRMANGKMAEMTEYADTQLIVSALGGMA